MTSDSSASLKAIWNQNEAQIHRDYFTFLKFQSISSEPDFKEECLSCAKWLENYLKEMGFKTSFWETSGHPVLFAEHLQAGSEQPTLLIYNHYDVQPVDPIELWETPPFEPAVRNGEVYARGAQDNKGQCFYTLQAIKTLLKRDGKLPINVKLVIEGEEECGSESLSSILKEKSEELKADYLAIVDMGIPSPDTPAVTLGVRGIVTMDVELTGPKSDLHSGSHGGVVMNPIHALIQMLSKLHDETGKVAVPGFYDAIAPISDQEKEAISFHFDEARYEKTFGVLPFGGEKGFSPKERAWIRPTIEINGIAGGYAGTGFKTVIPSKAIAKVSCRLVPNMEPHKIGDLVKKYLHSIKPKGIDLHVHIRPGSGSSVRANALSNIVKAFSKAYEEVFQKPCEKIFSGGSIPIIAELTEASKSEAVLMGLGLDDDHIHAPNEHFGLDRLKKGHLIIARTLEILKRGA